MRSRVSLFGKVGYFVATIGLIMLGAVAYTGWVGSKAAKAKSDAANTLVGLSTERLVKLGELRTVLLKASISLRDIALASNSDKLEQIVSGRQETLGKLTALLDDIDKNATPDERPYIDEIKSAIGAIVVELGTFDERFVKGRSGALPREQQAAAHQMIMEKIVPIRNRVENAFTDFAEFAARRQLEIKQEIETITVGFAKQQRVGDIGLILCVLVGGFMLGAFLRSKSKILNTGLSGIGSSR